MIGSLVKQLQMLINAVILLKGRNTIQSKEFGLGGQGMPSELSPER